MSLNNDILLFDILQIIHFTMWFESVRFLRNTSRSFCPTHILPIRHANTHTRTHYISMTDELNIVVYSEINPTRCNTCVYCSQWLYSTCFGGQFHPSSGVHMLYMASGRQVHLCCNFVSIMVVLSL